MKKLKCPVCGTENKEGTKYCRICFSRLVATSHKTFPLKSDFYSKVKANKNFFVLLFIFLLIFMIWILIK